MAYASWSVVFGEQPSAAKWNILGTNDAAFNDGTGIANLALNTTSISNPYKFHVYKSDAQNSSSGAYVKVTFATEQFDTNNNFASDTYTVPVTGYYHIFAKVKLATVALYQLAIYKNGSEYKVGGELEYTAARAAVTASFMDAFTSGDTLDVYVFDNSASAITTGQSNTYFGGYLVSHT